MAETPVYIGLGSNFADSVARLATARAAIDALAGVRVVASSRVYRTEPQGYRAQPWFANQVALAMVDGGWEPLSLVDAFLAIERELGRSREGSPRFGPRAIDVDLLLFGERVSTDPRCVAPHPRLLERAFVLVPLLELDPDLRVGGRPLRDALAGLNWRVEGDRIYQSPRPALINGKRND